MRVVSGDFGGRRLKAVPGVKTRPTTDKVKESIFNMIGPYFDGGMSLDLFAGSGGLSIEAVSRGIDTAVLVDKQRQAIQTIEENVKVTKADDQFKIIRQDAKIALNILADQGKKFDLVFLDPPYKLQKITQNMAKMVSLSLLNAGAILVCETDQFAKLPETLPNFKLWKRQDYGITEVSIYQFDEVGE
ncbi:16S rRNA (guanine(966)-N(2))-methyltransferase RsmD [Pediococcus inopinatus]|uniref:16S rRNA (guanine(966)-N(2))-methyltransferase RsmD n=1 Tax=Pediococcus inopinatus TaxID=114090 RepID=UPI002A6B6A6B|nr:16S rRNA (guanine(966)-N(2))-methyltransferase RsmD [Pediococcus inopinatus]WPC17806.1 16S rRNA (guanine(966)-N(2))-methyltransferase RsmD [Pediococcus inopinatus]WPP10023.1 16S rRNA (guanine(966)-N(2))-methyltransferase RsmD [Pediococcus inopinatus]